MTRQPCAAADRQQSRPGRGLPLLLLLALWLLAAGCSTHAQRVRQARHQFYQGDLASATEALREQATRHPRDADVLSLDLAVIELISGRPHEAERMLREVRDQFAVYDEPAAVDSALSMVTDDQRLAYAGEDYEQVLVRVFLTLASLLQDGQDAEAYSLQINALQQELRRRALDQQVEGAESAYSQLAIGPYVRGVLREATFHDYDDARRAYEQVVSWRPDFQAGQQDLLRARHAAHSQPEHGVLYVFALLDRGPLKEEAVEVPSTYALLVADRILSWAGEYELPPTIAPIKVPRIVVPPRQNDRVLVLADGAAAGETELLCDVAQLARRQQEVQFPHVMARAVARRVIKKASIYAVKDSLEVDNSWTDLALTAAGVVWEATESADTRCWGVLPREIQVLRLELPVGTHEIQLCPVAGGRALPSGRPVPVPITDGRNTYLLAYLVGNHTIGQIVHSNSQ